MQIPNKMYWLPYLYLLLLFWGWLTSLTVMLPYQIEKGPDNFCRKSEQLFVSAPGRAGSPLHSFGLPLEASIVLLQTTDAFSIWSPKVIQSDFVLPFAILLLVSVGLQKYYFEIFASYWYSDNNRQIKFRRGTLWTTCVSLVAENQSVRWDILVVDGRKANRRTDNEENLNVLLAERR